MKRAMLFSDGSVQPQQGIGYGAYLLVQEDEPFSEVLKERIKVKRFEQVSSTSLELQTLIWALEEIKVKHKKIIVYTDSQNIIGLPGRRKRLEQNNYRSAKNRLLNNAERYQHFFSIIDQLDCVWQKVQGHLPSAQKKEIDRFFTLVDRASRHALRTSSD